MFVKDYVVNDSTLPRLLPHGDYVLHVLQYMELRNVLVFDIKFTGGLKLKSFQIV